MDIVVFNQTDDTLYVYPYSISCSEEKTCASGVSLDPFKSKKLSLGDVSQNMTLSFFWMDFKGLSQFCFDTHHKNKQFDLVNAPFFPEKNYEVLVTAKKSYGVNSYFCSIKEQEANSFGELENYRDGKSYPENIMLDGAEYKINHAGLIKGFKELVKKIIAQKGLQFFCGAADDDIILNYSPLKEIIPKEKMIAFNKQLHELKKKQRRPGIVMHSGPEELSMQNWAFFDDFVVQALVQKYGMAAFVDESHSSIVNEKIIKMLLP